MTVYLLPEEPFFPPVSEAEPDGLIAIGGDLSVERLIQAYAHGIFPWFSEDDEIYWYSPDPRMVMFPDRFIMSDSMKRFTRNNSFIIRFDTVFEQVIRDCAAIPRPEQDGTWISEDFIEGYNALHSSGFAHSVEVFHGEELVGGLYGVSVGSAFFGESMFYKRNNASKVAFHALVEYCRKNQFRFIDCQVKSSHLQALGASLIPREKYLQLLGEAMDQPTIPGPWSV